MNNSIFITLTWDNLDNVVYLLQNTTAEKARHETTFVHELRAPRRSTAFRLNQDGSCELIAVAENETWAKL